MKQIARYTLLVAFLLALGQSCVIAADSPKAEELQTQRYLVGKRVISKKADPQKALEVMGLNFKTPGSSARWDYGRILEVKNTAANLDRLKAVEKEDVFELLDDKLYIKSFNVPAGFISRPLSEVRENFEKDGISFQLPGCKMTSVNGRLIVRNTKENLYRIEEQLSINNLNTSNLTLRVDLIKIDSKDVLRVFGAELVALEKTDLNPQQLAQIEKALVEKRAFTVFSLTGSTKYNAQIKVISQEECRYLEDFKKTEEGIYKPIIAKNEVGDSFKAEAALKQNDENFSIKVEIVSRIIKSFESRSVFIEKQKVKTETPLIEEKQLSTEVSVRPGVSQIIAVKNESASVLVYILTAEVTSL